MCWLKPLALRFVPRRATHVVPRLRGTAIATGSGGDLPTLVWQGKCRSSPQRRRRARCGRHRVKAGSSDLALHVSSHHAARNQQNSKIGSVAPAVRTAGISEVTTAAMPRTIPRQDQQCAGIYDAAWSLSSGLRCSSAHAYRQRGEVMRPTVKEWISDDNQACFVPDPDSCATEKSAHIGQREIAPLSYH